MVHELRWTEPLEHVVNMKILSCVLVMVHWLALNVSGASLDISGDVSYNVTDSTIVLRAGRIQNNSSGGSSGTIRMELWAFTSPYSGSGGGYKLASFTLNQLSGGYSYTAVSSGSVLFSPPPPGRFYFSMLVREYTDTGSDGFTTRDYSNFSSPVRVAGGAFLDDIQIIGQTSWRVSGNKVTLQVEKVSNVCNLGNSGSLHLDLWATASPYSGGPISGYRLGTVQLNPLKGGYAYNNVNQTVAYSEPPDGRYYMTLTLSEYHNGSYVIVDYLTYQTSQGLGTPPSVPSVNGAISVNSSGFVATWGSASRAFGYRLDVSTSSVFSSYAGGYQSFDVGNSLSRSITGLNPSTTYYYRVRAYNGVGTSDDSGVATATTLPIPPPAPALATVSGTTNNGFVASWSSVFGAKGYRLDVSTSSAFTSFVAGYQNLDVGASLSRVVAKLNPGTSYYYRARAYNDAGESRSSTVAGVTTLPDYSIYVSASSGTGGTATGGGTASAGSQWTVTAKPSKLHTFVNWTENGTTVSASATYSFTLHASRNLTANFAASPFVAAKGVYTGLCEGSGSFDSSGAFTLTVTDRASYSGKLVLAGKSYSISGLFDSAGRTTSTIARTGINALYLELQLDLNGNDVLHGTIRDAVRSLAEISTFRSPYSKLNPTREAGKYAFMVIGDTNGVASPAGHSIGTVMIGTTGVGKLQMTLADGSKFLRSMPLSKDGQLPLYVSLYGGRGSVLSWLTIASRTEDDIHGIVTWIKLSQPLTRYYADGFAVRSQVVGSRYNPPLSGQRVLSFSNAGIELSGGDLQQPLANEIQLDANNKVTNLSANKMTMTLLLSTGAFKGSVTDPMTARGIPFQGVLMQKGSLNYGAGFFLGTNRSGSVYFGE